MFKGTNYVGSLGPKFGGFYGDSPQPKAGWQKFDNANHQSKGDSASSKGSLLGKNKWKSTCKGCGGKM
jgi:hypothetical protein